ncbi:MAG: hypothetical protein WB567_11650 [Terracidiphilus sp.]
MKSVPLPLATAPSQHIRTANPAMGAERALVLWHLTSLDAPTVAAVWSLAFAWSSDQHVRPWTLLLLVLATWCIYVLDRLLDAHSGLQAPLRNGLRERHIFHWRHRVILLPLAGGAACAAAAVVFTLLPSIVWEPGSVMAIASFTYLSGVHLRQVTTNYAAGNSRFFPTKEFFVALLFTAGCALPSWSRMHASSAMQSSVWPFWVPAGCFAALAWLNCVCIAHWETADTSPAPCERDQRASWFYGIGMPAHFLAAIFLAIIGMTLAAIAVAAHPRTAALLVAASTSAILLALLDRFRGRIAPSTLRAAADLALLTPVALLLR